MISQLGLCDLVVCLVFIQRTSMIKANLSGYISIQNIFLILKSFFKDLNIFINTKYIVLLIISLNTKITFFNEI